MMTASPPTPAPTFSALKREAPVRNTEGKVFRHVYCDELDGTSLGPLIGSGVKLSPEVTGNSEVTQRMTCKTPGHARKHPSESQNNVSSVGWIDHCPNKGIPRLLLSVQWDTVALS